MRTIAVVFRMSFAKVACAIKEITDRLLITPPQDVKRILGEFNQTSGAEDIQPQGPGPG